MTSNVEPDHDDVVLEHLQNCWIRLNVKDAQVANVGFRARSRRCPHGPARIATVFPSYALELCQIHHIPFSWGCSLVTAKVRGSSGDSIRGHHQRLRVLFPRRILSGGWASSLAARFRSKPVSVRSTEPMFNRPGDHEGLVPMEWLELRTRCASARHSRTMFVRRHLAATST
jgi:hypothetical protein